MRNYFCGTDFNCRWRDCAGAGVVGRIFTGATVFGDVALVRRGYSSAVYGYEFMRAARFDFGLFSHFQICEEIK